ncbi:Nitrogen regulatory protein [Thalassoglobus neptunius]|uniref:Nitrogen regulatory protein n=1 Tax=Thalassoglobus neptunius TaxID=1938619 RepID=A0A5C5WN32_9PLAN|nr:PTS sugar transporter subunit IIA [Thalassoglobus neptunius]TWT52224.1 Nitrogen regulatory protein [Thalassoglobus neptunius]
MAHEWYSIDELARQLGRDRREIERLASRGRIPAHKRGQDWQFHAAEITQWLEQEMREYSDSQLAALEVAQASPEIVADVPVTSLLKPELVQVPLEARTKRSVLECMIEVAGRTWQVWEPATILKAVQEREKLHSTAFDNGVAIPHPRNPLADAVGAPLVAFGRTSSGIPFGASNNSLSDCFFLVLCQDTRSHLQVIARLARMVQLPDFLPELRAAEDSEAAYSVILSAESQFG